MAETVHNASCVRRRDSSRITQDAIYCDVLGVLDALAASRGAIELNADPHRLDLPSSWIPAARERGISFVNAESADVFAARVKPT